MITPFQTRFIHILLADDDEDDRFLIKEAFQRQFTNCQVSTVDNGEELLDFLNDYDQDEAFNRQLPDLILLDLNMPRLDGRNALKVIKQNPAWRHIPIIIMTTSDASPDIELSYLNGANSFITKPATFQQLTHVASVIGQYWFDIVTTCNHTVEK